MRLLTALILILLMFSATFAQKTKGAETKPRFVHEIDLRKLLPKFLTPQGFLDPKFADAVATPSLYYSDFYGIQALKDTTKESIKRDFVPKFAEIVSEDENSIELKFKNGFSGKFYPHSVMKAVGQLANFDHVEISGETWQNLLKNLESFKNLLQSAKLTTRYLIPNPSYKDELVVAKQLANNKTTVAVPTTTLENFNKEKNAVLLYPEGVHGVVEGYKKFKADVLDKQKLDWIAMEMLGPTMQKDLDIFVNVPENSPEHLRTRKVLLDYFKDAWNGRSGPKTTAEENYYFKIVEQMRQQKTRVVAVENGSLEYIFFRYGENKFGAAVRSLWWAKLLPKMGKGLIFGGSGHFTNDSPINFQDLLSVINPKIKMFVLEEIKVRKS